MCKYVASQTLSKRMVMPETLAPLLRHLNLLTQQQQETAAARVRVANSSSEREKL